MERMIPNEMTGPLDTDYFDGYSEVITTTADICASPCFGAKNKSGH
jgi:hypothetical protein